jgi:hypothetical protein
MFRIKLTHLNYICIYVTGKYLCDEHSFIKLITFIVASCKVGALEPIRMKIKVTQ